MTDTSKEAVEREAYWMDKIAAEVGGYGRTATAGSMLRALLSERDALRAQLQAAREPTVEQAARVLWKAFVSDESETNFKPAWNAWKHRIWACDGSIYSAMSAWLKTLAGSSPKSTSAEGDG